MDIDYTRLKFWKLENVQETQNWNLSSKTFQIGGATTTTQQATADTTRILYTGIYQQGAHA